MQPYQVGQAMKEDRLSEDLHFRWVWVPGRGVVDYLDDDTLVTLAERHEVYLDAIIRDGTFASTMLKKGARLTLPNIPPNCEIISAPPLQALPRKVFECVPPIFVRPQGIRYLGVWAGELAWAYFPKLSALVAGFVALGWALRRARALPRPEEWGE
jgi:hypothetical protein